MKRKAKISRKTKETSINVDLNIDGKGTVSYTHLTLPTSPHV